MKIRTIISLLAFSLVFATAMAGQEKKDIQFFGRVIAVQAAGGTATIEHGNIPGFMAAMTMDYGISPKSMLEKLHPGDDIRAIAHTGDNTLYNVKIVSRGSSKRKR